MSKKYAAIIGLNPSEGARSPKLWNQVYREINADIEMICVDIKDPSLFNKSLNKLKDDKDFLGGCIAFPYKEKTAEYLGFANIDKVSRPIGSVNCLYRSKNGDLIGANTDGDAALSSFLSLTSNNQLQKILIAGLGGAGKAVATYISQEFIPKGTKVISTSRSNQKSFCQSIDVDWISWNTSKSFISDFDAFINCTTIGTGEQKNISPIDNKVVMNSKLRFVFDIIYDPSPTLLLKQSSAQNINTKGGLEMNLLQAVKAFNLVNKLKTNNDDVLKIMKTVN
ncbi:shikimate dehydrogenase family protein [Prochlorococcus marinus]|uniref:shikimate dehydrogenase family protein n=1 Tax=Prochlorococcus marinus TaxID=1219 RepID=UPI0022B426D0|nr:hypothetical protein [Prochlorococcus marinus]